MLIVSPVAATVPAMPRPMGTRISASLSPWATFDQIWRGRRSTRNRVERSASPPAAASALGRAQDRARAIAGAAVHVGIEARVGVRVGDVDALAAGRHAAGDALADGHADLARLETLRDLGPQLVPLLVHHEER